MPNKQLRLEGTISSSDVMLGGGKKSRNKIVVKLVNTGDHDLELSDRGDEGTLFLTASVGNRAEDFVAKLEDATGVTIESAANWQKAPYKTSSGQITWSFLLPDNILKAKAETSLTLIDFECETDPGTAKLALRVAISGYDDYQETLNVDKKDPAVLQILYFEADPPIIIADKDRAAFALEWNTIKAGTVSLFKANVPILTLQEGDKDSFQNKQRYSYSAPPPSFTAIYKLLAIDRVDPTIKQDKEVTVHVLERGWRRLKDFRSSMGYPSVVCNLDGLKLYGIWIKKGKADLYSSTHPWAIWNPESASVPEKMSTSPAVCFANQLWLIGGSTADLRNFSNQIWCYGSEWSRKADADWIPRMGHACVVMKNRIWVLGGMDTDGTALNEVWSWDGKGKWTRHKDAPWAPRCMQAATLFKDAIWIYGGLTEPFGDPLEDVWTSRDGENWERQKAPEDQGKPIGKPIGSALQGLKGELNLLGTFRTGTLTPSMQCILQGKQQTWRPSPISDEKAWDPQEGNTFSLLSVEYKGIAFVRSLNYQTADNPTDLNMFIP